jgi:hypothetical protein
VTAVAELTIEQRVEAGASWLDQHAPGWFDVVDLGRLDVSEPECCPLGFIYGNWWDAPEPIAMRADLGFYYRHDHTEYEPLTDAWRAEIERRRAEAGTA